MLNTDEMAEHRGFQCVLASAISDPHQTMREHDVDMSYLSTRILTSQSKLSELPAPPYYQGSAKVICHTAKLLVTGYCHQPQAISTGLGLG